MSEAPPRPPPRFADFADPFAWGIAPGRSLRELVAYSFAALEAWAREHACPREPDQTPCEFALQIGRQAPNLAVPTRDFANLYSTFAYTNRTPKAENVVLVQRLWQVLESDSLESAPFDGRSP